MTKDEALKLAHEALKKFHYSMIDAGVLDRQEVLNEGFTAATAIKEALAQPEPEPANKYCCHLCFNKSGQLFLDRMILCPECGNKRCPKATHHELPCTNSNEPNQAGSVYTTPPQRTERPADCERCNRLEEQAYDLVGKLRVANIKLSMPPQRTWVGLTDEERKNIMIECESTGDWAWELKAAQAIEAKLKEKNT